MDRSRAAYGMESFLTHPVFDHLNRQQENPLSGRPSNPPVAARLIPSNELKNFGYRNPFYAQAPLERQVRL
jgi:hypothetical protein